MASVALVYNSICLDLAEDNGLILGILTIAQFIDLFNLTLMDFLSQTGLIKRVFTQTVFAGQGQYAIPDDIMRVDYAFVAGRWIPRSTAQDLNNTHRDWRKKVEFPRAFHEDELPIKTMELASKPNFSGAYIPGSAEPDPPHGVYDSFSATAIAGSNPAALLNPANLRGLSIVGPRAPIAVTNLTDQIPLIPDDWALSYLPFGILERIFSSDSELKDTQRALYAGANYKEGVSLAKAIMGESEAEAA